MQVLVTGGAGYIGSHAVRALQRAGHQPVVLDNLVYGHRDIAATLGVPLVEGQVGDRALLDSLLSGQHPALAGTAAAGQPIGAVMHFAAYAYVGESVADPAKYYRNNLADTLVLLEALIDPRHHRPRSSQVGGTNGTPASGPMPIVFSSTCATYGVPQQIPITEDHPQAPINPYGRSKYMVEQLLRDFGAAYGLPSVIFRYFNAAGADPDGDLGEDHNPETHLIPLVLDVMAGRSPYLQIFGDDYPTPDGTCIRDYIHIADLCEAHWLALQHLSHGGDSDAFNLGNGSGFSVQEVIETARQVTGRTITVQEGPRRAGDPARLVADATRARQVLGWQPQYADLAVIIAHAWRWECART
jgi:UDP-glucose 4-epimerase